MVQLVAVALYDRGHFSRGNARRLFGYEAYHWGIVVMPEDSEEQDYRAYDATDISEINPVTFRLSNPTMDWWYRVTENTESVVNPRLLGRIVIGQVPDGTSSAELREFFGRVRLPVKNTDPQQSCVTWTVDAIRALQTQGWGWEFELDQFKGWALSYADDRIREDSKEPSVKYYSVQD
ncbi:hypothetical protein AK830_g10754 [Neonectria ditissima]|uniref:Uncharacterized protein n=1 Tax=Neonectria ditissima TaxID=78410 RepID=A0A0P7B2Z9_9HYPO|nr:hypothetical protein AK830_g10754 [Neonectria ditissima]